MKNFMYLKTIFKIPPTRVNYIFEKKNH